MSIYNINCAMHSEGENHTTTSKIIDYACESSNKPFGLSYVIQNCIWSFTTYQSVIDSVTSHLMSCKAYITEYLRNHELYMSSVRIFNNTPFQSEHIQYIAEQFTKLHSSLPNKTEIIVNLTNPNILLNKTKALISEYTDVQINNINKSLTLSNNATENIQILNDFFGKPIKPEAQVMDTTSEDMTITLLLIGGACIAVVGIGVAYIYNKNYHNNNAGDNSCTNTEMEEYHKVDTIGESLTAYHDSVDILA